MYRPRFSILLSILTAVAMMVGPNLTGFAGLEDAVAEAKSKTKSARKTKKKPTKAKKAKRKNKRSKRARRRRRRSRTTGHAVAQSKLRTETLTRPSGNVWVFTENQHEEVRVNIYDENGDFDDGALAKLDHEFRCRRTKELRAFDPRLYEMLSRIQDHFDGKRIHLVSGFRFQKNEGSRHYHASAMDIRIPGVSIKEIRAYAASLDRGGMGIGIYPRSGFIHIDFRAPGEPSYRWVDRSRRGTGNKGKGRSRRYKRNRRNS
ncbi:MAG: YcbK family protein [Kofleriaceae bacterium]|nr:YcbK family protein [Kofleriaceae bacterium]